MANKSSIQMFFFSLRNLEKRFSLMKCGCE